MIRVVQTASNGYRCCCYSDWVYEYEADDREAVLKSLAYKKGSADSERIAVDVYEDGKLIAFARLEWYSSTTRGDQYKNYRWFGEIEGVPFDERFGNCPEELPEVIPLEPDDD